MRDHRPFFVVLATLACVSLRCTVTQTKPTFDAAPDDGAVAHADGAWTDAAQPPDADSGAPKDAGTGAKLVFVTKSSYLADLRYEGKAATGLEGADNICNRAASVLADQRPHGTFQAWISTSSVDAIDHITGKGPWYTYSGALAFADKASIPAGPLAFINECENGNAIDPIWVATGTFATGRKDPTANCADWTDQSPHWFRYGISIFAATNWTSQGTAECSKPFHLYCFEI